MIADNIENWRLIDGYDKYEVSSHGFVRNNKTGRILKHSITTGDIDMLFYLRAEN